MWPWTPQAPLLATGLLTKSISTLGGSRLRAVSKLSTARPSCLRLFLHWLRRAASRAA